jgi:molybdenum cofactor cytidylyltransferase
MASGFSRRFGSENKLLVPFRGKPLVRHTLELVCAMTDSFSGIFFAAADECVAAIARDFPVTLIHNNAPEKGRRESVRLGVAAAGESDYYFFFPCDQPLLDEETIRLILKARQPGKIVEPFFSGAVYSGCHGSRDCSGSPSLFSAAFQNELLTLGEGEKPKVIKERHPDALIRVEVTNPLALFDIDNPDAISFLSTG